MLAVHTSRPATRPANSFGKFGVHSFNPAAAGFDKFGAFHPADPLVASERGDVVPGIKRFFVSKQRLAKILRHGVDGASGE